MLQDMQVVVPKLVLDEECHLRTYGSQKAACIANGVEWQIADDVGTLVVLAHLIARGREERQQNLDIWMFALHLLHQRTALLELAQRGSMEPYVAGLGIYLLAKHTDGLALAVPHLTDLLVEKAVDDDTKLVEIDDDIVH